MSVPYIISKSLDPVFAIAIGLAAAGVRIRREEREEGHSMNETFDAGKRRVKNLLSSHNQPNDTGEARPRSTE
ncbi:MAG: hypothetical protein M1820_002208 [Bogoriella megaspora]|nr:MAG: hypothetical protein M1820_002208 [Bogoriella megaspora]